MGEYIITGLMLIKENTFALRILTTGTGFMNPCIEIVFRFMCFIPCSHDLFYTCLQDFFALTHKNIDAGK